MAKGNRPTTSTFLDNEIKNNLGLSNNDIKRLSAMVDSQDYDPRVLYRDYKNDPKYEGIKSISDSYDANTKTIQLDTPSIAIDYIKNNMPDDYLTKYVKNGKRTNKLADELETYATYDTKRKYSNVGFRYLTKQTAANVLYDAVHSAVTIRHNPKVDTDKRVRTFIPKTSSKFLREAAAIIALEYYKKNKYYIIK